MWSPSSGGAPFLTSAPLDLYTGLIYSGHLSVWTSPQGFPTTGVGSRLPGAGVSPLLTHSHSAPGLNHPFCPHEVPCPHTRQGPQCSAGHTPAWALLSLLVGSLFFKNPLDILVPQKATQFNIHVLTWKSVHNPHSHSFYPPLAPTTSRQQYVRMICLLAEGPSNSTSTHVTRLPDPLGSMPSKSM